MWEQTKTLTEVIRYFENQQNCIDACASMRWPDGKPVCPRCDSEKNHWLAKQLRWKCYGCGKQFSVKVGTVMEDSPIALDKWLVTLWMLVNCKNGISSYEVMRTVGVTQKSAWFMLQRLRLALQDDKAVKIGGTVEVDETFIGGSARNMHSSRRRKAMAYRHKGKSVVLGFLERGGRVRTEIIEDRDKTTLHSMVKSHVKKGSELMTDEFLSYFGLDEHYAHNVINHAFEYAKGHIHTNGMENFWSLLKRCLGGTYISVAPFHLFRYLDEQAYRYNNRKYMTDNLRFKKALSQIAGKRLTYVELTGQVGETA